MSKLTNWINEASKNRNTLRLLDKREQKAGRMSPYTSITKEGIVNKLNDFNVPIKVNGVYVALIGTTDYFQNGEEFLDNSNFLGFADALAISEGVSEETVTRTCSTLQGNSYTSERMKKLSIRWHMPGDSSFSTIHCDGPGYDFPSNCFVDIYKIFDRVSSK